MTKKDKVYYGAIPENFEHVVVPIVFIPGIMGTRLRNPGAGATIWDPDSSWWFLQNLVRGTYAAKRAIIGVNPLSPVAEPIPEDQGMVFDTYNKDQHERGFPQCFSSYEKILKYLDKEFNSKNRRDSLKKFGIESPVEVIGYDWRNTIPLILTALRKRFDELSVKYSNICKIPATEIPFIIVTHSMGGLVVRKFLKMFPDMEEKVLAVVHGDQPAVGAPIFYAYFKSGALRVAKESANTMKDRLLAAALGENAVNFQYISSAVPGSLILLPTNDYVKKKWLTWNITSQVAKTAMNNIDSRHGGKMNPNKSVYDYYKDQSGYVGLLSKKFIDKHQIDFWVERFMISLGLAKKFHEDLGEGEKMYEHPVTYEISSNDLKTVVGVNLREKPPGSPQPTGAIQDDGNASSVKDLIRDNPFIPDQDDPFIVDINFIDSGDATVPITSQMALSQIKKVFGSQTFSGASHTESFDLPGIQKYTADSIEEIMMHYVASVYFEQSSSSISDKHKTKLDRLIKVMMGNKGRNYKITGWASQEGSDSYNYPLSDDRANAVAKYISDKIAESTGVSIEQYKNRDGKKIYKLEDFAVLTVMGLGPWKQVFDNQKTRERCRRVDVRFA
jgi:flagellar motor protein MotB